MLSIYPGKTVSSFNLPSLLFLRPNTKFNLLARPLAGAQVHTPRTQWGRLFLRGWLRPSRPPAHPCTLRESPPSLFAPWPHTQSSIPHSLPCNSSCKVPSKAVLSNCIHHPHLSRPLSNISAHTTTIPWPSDPHTHWPPPPPLVLGPWTLFSCLSSFSPEVIASGFMTYDTICTSMVSKYFSPLSFRDHLAPLLNISQPSQT